MITEYFEKLLNQKTVPEVRDDGRGYGMWDDGGVEAEVGEFIYGLVRLMKPKLVCETGLYTGISCSYIAQGLKDNGYGKLDTVEWEAIHIKTARERIGRLALDNYVNFVQSDSMKFDPKIDPERYDLLWLDTELNLRLHELVRYFPYLKDGGFVLIHDFLPSLYQGNINPDHPDFLHWPMGEIPQQVTDWVKDGQLRPMFFPNPRGMMMLYKPRLDEHKWV